MEWAADKLSDKWWSEESEGTDKLEETVRDCHSQLQPRVGGPGQRLSLGEGWLASHRTCVPVPGSLCNIGIGDLQPDKRQYKWSQV